jgi:repressor LexA
MPVAENPLALTPQQQKCLEFLSSYRDTNGYFPSVREISKHLGSEHANTAGTCLKILERKGYIYRIPNTQRAFDILVQA